MEFLAEKKDFRDTIVRLTMSARGGTPAAAGSELRKSTKIADPELLDDGKDPKFEHWLSRMRNKLKSNTNHFSTEDLRMAYIEERTKGAAAQHIYPRMQQDYPEVYKTAEEIFQHLANVYKDPDKLQTTKEDFRKLFMKNGSDFQTFRTEFLHLAGKAKVPRVDYVQEFFSKLFFEIKPHVAAHKTSKLFKEFEAVCNSVAPTLSKARGSGKKQIEFDKKTSAASSANPNTAALSGTSKGQTPEDRQALMKEGRCFFCKEHGYMKP
jgi:hypothetical protein